MSEPGAGGADTRGGLVVGVNIQFNIIYIMRTNISTGLNQAFRHADCCHQGILMTAHKAVFFTLDEVNRLKISQVVVDRRLTTQMAAQRLIASADAF